MKNIKGEILKKIKVGNRCFVFDGLFSSCYKILEVKDNVISLDLTSMESEDVQANKTYNLLDYSIKIDDCTNKIESIDYGIEFFNDSKRVIAIEVF